MDGTADETDDPPDTPAIRAIGAIGIAHQVRTIDRPTSLEDAATKLDVDPERLLKTLVVRRGPDDHLLVVIPGARRMDWPKLREHLGVSRISLPEADAAQAVTGYERGTITPFGTRTPLPVIVDASIAGAGTVTIGGGAHGVSLRLDADVLLEALHRSGDVEVVAVT